MFAAGSCQIPLHYLVRSQLRTSSELASVMKFGFETIDETAEEMTIDSLERLERDQSKVQLVGVDAARPEVLVEQLGALGRVDARLPARRPAAERPSERRRPRRRTAGAAGRRRRRRTERLHRQPAGPGRRRRRLVGLDARVDRRLVAERPPSQRRRDDAGHRRDRATDRERLPESIDGRSPSSEQTLSCTRLLRRVVTCELLQTDRRTHAGPVQRARWR